ncbi:MAG: hypothetical protein WAT58_09420 [Candidatus Dormiibacterota bacterium]
MLAGYTGERPAEVELVRSLRGKPHLARQLRLRFSLAHCDGVDLAAVCTNRAVGVDIERVDPGFPHDKVQSWLGSMPRLVPSGTTEPRQAFYTSWVATEAICKADGGGLASYLERGGDAAGRHRVHWLDMGSDFVAAIATEGSKPVRVHWPESTPCIDGRVISADQGVAQEP